MSVVRFHGGSGPIVVTGEMTGPAGSGRLRLLLDTGATTSLVSVAALLSVGIDPTTSRRQAAVTTGSAAVAAPLVVPNRLSALGRHRLAFPVLAHTLPTVAKVDGVLGLEFLRGQVLTIDFRAGRITLA